MSGIKAEVFYKWDDVLMNIDQKIQKACASQGGILPAAFKTDPLIAPVIKCFDAWKDYAQSELYKLRPDKKLRYEIVDNGRFGARAQVLDDEHDLVIFNVGTIVVLQKIFSRMLSNPNVLKHIGKPDVEDEKRSFSTSTKIPKSIAEIGQNNFSVPNDHSRDVYHRTLLTWALNSIFLHEITHLKNGHYEYLFGPSNYLSITEEDESTPDYIAALTRQTLERDADLVPIVHLINRGFTIVDGLGTTLLHDTFAFKDKGAFIEMLWFAIYTTFRMLNAPEVNFNVIQLKTHPSPPARQMLIADELRGLTAQLKPEDNFSVEQCDEITMNTIFAVEEAYGFILQKEPEITGVGSTLVQHKEFYEYEDKLYKRWKEIRPELQKYIRGGKLPPQ